MKVKEAEKVIGVTFKNRDLLKQAFTHRSYINENRGTKMHHNERLEFLGDAVLELSATEFLYNKFPKKTEGDLTSYRAALVNTQSLSSAAAGLDFNKFLLLSKGEAKDTGRARQYILANTFEAVIGAIYMDQGFGPSDIFLKKFLFPSIDEILEQGLFIDAKSRLQEMAQENLSITPIYETLNESGPDHEKSFVVGVFFDDEKVSRGEGNSKQEAEQEAAREALKKKEWI